MSIIVDLVVSLVLLVLIVKYWKENWIGALLVFNLLVGVTFWASGMLPPVLPSILLGAWCWCYRRRNRTAATLPVCSETNNEWLEQARERRKKGVGY